MDNFRYVNAGDSTLSAGIVAGDTQLSVANPGRFPAALEVGEKLVLTLHPSGLPSTQEIVICTAISGGVMTVTRGAQGTTAQGWPAGTVVGAYLTSEMLGQIRDKLMPISGTNTGDETAARIGILTAGAVAKTTPANADLIGLADSAASNTLKKLTWSELKAALKTYFDTLYNKYVHPNHSGDVTSVADGAQTIAANAVTNMKLADMANATIKGRVTAGAGDPEDLTAAQARSILNVADGAQKNSNITKAEIEAKLTGTITSHDHGVTGLPLTGGTLTGNLTISNAAPTIILADTDHITRSLHANSNLVGFLNSSGGWSFHSSNTGVNTSIGNMVVGSATYATDGNVYMPWAGDWLSNILANRLTKDAGSQTIGSFALIYYEGNNVNLVADGLYSGSAVRLLGIRLGNSGGSNVYLNSQGAAPGTWRVMVGSSYAIGYWPAAFAQRVA